MKSFISPMSLLASLVLLSSIFAGLVSAAAVAPDSSGNVTQHTFRQVGQTIMGNPLDVAIPEQHVEFGSIVRLSKDGKRMAVAASPNMDHDGQVFVYERDESTVDEDVAQATWRPMFELEGNTEDTVGANIALSEDGNFLAIRRGKEVDVYLHNAASQEFELGPSPINPTFANETCKWGKGLTLGQTSTGSATFLLVSCESYKKAQGKVDVFFFNPDNKTWEPITTLKPPKPANGNRFGWETALLVRDSQQDAITVAVSSPNDNEKTGLVQTFRVFTKKNSSRQIGEDLKGLATGDVFGFSLDMSLSGASAGNPALVVGAPQCSSEAANGTGCVTVYHWNAVDAWNAVGEPFYGLEANDRLGRSVVITRDGRRFGASSIRHKWQQGQVRLFEQNVITTDYEHIGDLVGDTRMSRWGESIALNEYGSMIASGAIRSKSEYGDSVGSVQVWLDDSPFCSHPPSSDATLEDLFLTRRVCGKAAIDALDCTSVKCVWVEDLPKAITPTGTETSDTLPPLTNDSAEVTTSPSSAPSSAPSYHPTTFDENWFDSDDESNGTSYDELSDHTAAPSSAPTQSDDVTEGVDWNDEPPTTADSTDAPTSPDSTGAPTAPPTNDAEPSSPAPLAAIASAGSFSLLAAGVAGVYKKYCATHEEDEDDVEEGIV